MSAIIEEPLTLEVVFVEAVDNPQVTSPEAWERNRREVLASNQEALTVESESLAAFMDLLYAADPQYIETEEYMAPPAAPAVDWDAVSDALSESQQILIGMQNLLAATFAAMGLEDYQYIRVYADQQGLLRLVADHPRREEIEATLNSPANTDLRTLYHSAMAGMSLAGSLVGSMSLPEEVLAKVKAKEKEFAA